MACTIDFSSLPLLTNCPGDAEQFLVGNAVGGLDPSGGYTTGFARRSWGTLKNCLISSLFGGGGLIFTGDMLDGSNIYINSEMPPTVLVFYNGLGRFLNYGTEWKYVNNTDTISGIQILIASTFGPSDYFTVLPNP